MSHDLDPTLVQHLRRQGWSLTQIAALVGQDEDAILRALREPAHDRNPAAALAMGKNTAVPSLQVRLSHHAQHLQIWLPADAMSTPTEILLAQVHAECEHQGLAISLTAAELEQRMRFWVYGTWLTVLEAPAATPPTPDRIHLLIPVKMSAYRTGGMLCPVRRGTPLARRELGTPGQPGRDLVGRPVEPRPARAVSLPQGQNTHLSADGMTLLASCDGHAVLRNLKLHVLPMTIHEGDVTAADGVLTAEGGMIITGAVRERGVIRAAGDIFVQRGVHASQITSTHGSITVRGAIGGTAHELSMLRAALDIRCQRVSHAVLEAAAAIVVDTEAHYSTLRAGGNITLTQGLERSLFDVQLAVGGGIVVPVDPWEPPVDAPTERQHTRVPMALPAVVAPHGPPPFVFTPCIIADLSPGGARCQFATTLPDAFTPNLVLQLKLPLPGAEGDVVVIARIARLIPPREIGVAFLQITERDIIRVTQYYREQLQTQHGFRPGSRADRRGGR